jgi:hypothetical protein
LTVAEAKQGFADNSTGHWGCSSISHHFIRIGPAEWIGARRPKLRRDAPPVSAR